MGMDVYGKAPTSEEGEYFRVNVWYWHPLWECCSHFAPKLTQRVRYGHSNDGDGLDADGSWALGVVLEDAIRRGEMARYIADRDAALAALPDEPCELCDGSGIRSDALGKEHGMPERVTQREDGTTRLGWCNGCDGVGHIRPSATWYKLDLETVAEFRRFLAHCGGFEIW